MFAIIYAIIAAWLAAWAVMAWRLRVAYRRDCERNAMRALAPRSHIVQFSPYRDL